MVGAVATLLVSHLVCVNDGRNGIAISQTRIKAAKNHRHTRIFVFPFPKVPSTRTRAAQKGYAAVVASTL